MNVESLKILVEGKTNPILKTSIKVKQEYFAATSGFDRGLATSYLNHSLYFYTNESTVESNSKFFVKYNSTNTESSASYINKSTYNNSYYSIKNYKLNSDINTYECYASYNIENAQDIIDSGTQYYYFFTTLKFNIGFDFDSPNKIIENLKNIKMYFDLSYEVIA